MKRLLALTTIVVFLPLICFGQNPVPKDKAVIYVYSFNSEKTLGTIRKSMLLDDKVVADMTPGRYFILIVDPGVHTISFKSKDWGGVEKEFRADSVTYIRTGWKSGLTVRPTGVDVVGAESGAFDIKQLRPVEPGNIKNKIIAFRQMPGLRTNEE